MQAENISNQEKYIFIFSKQWKAIFTIVSGTILFCFIYGLTGEFCFRTKTTERYMGVFKIIFTKISGVSRHEIRTSFSNVLFKEIVGLSRL